MFFATNATISSSEGLLTTFTSSNMSPVSSIFLSVYLKWSLGTNPELWSLTGAHNCIGFPSLDCSKLSPDHHPTSFWSRNWEYMALGQVRPTWIGFLEGTLWLSKIIRLFLRSSPIYMKRFLAQHYFSYENMILRWAQLCTTMTPV